MKLSANKKKETLQAFVAGLLSNPHFLASCTKIQERKTANLDGSSTIHRHLQINAGEVAHLAVTTAIHTLLVLEDSEELEKSIRHLIESKEQQINKVQQINETT